MDRTRASDTERERVVGILREAATNGRITVDELDERSAAAYAAVTRGQLGLLIEDLPKLPPPLVQMPPVPPPSAPHRGPAVFAPVGYRAPAPPPWVKPWPGLRSWMPGWQMFSQTFRLPPDPQRAGRVIIDHVVPLFLDAGFEQVRRTDSQLVFRSEDDVTTIDMASLPDHTEAHIWGVAPRSIRAELERLSK